MSYDPIQQPISARADARVIDAGLQAHMRSVYNTMCYGLVITAGVAYAVAHIEPLFNFVFNTPFIFVAMFAPLLFLSFGLSERRVAGMTADKARSLFLLFSVVMGVSFSAFFVAYTGASLARGFVVTSGTFAAMSLYGYTTKRDLTSMASFLFMGLIGVVFALIVNIWLQSAMLDFVVCSIAVIVFTGLTAWHTQMIKEAYAENAGREANEKLATMGALRLYMSFINLFQFIMRLMNQRN